MKINIDNSEINTAIKEYIVSQGIDVSDSDVRVEFTAGRSKGNTALITIAPKGTLEPLEDKKPKKTVNPGKGKETAAPIENKEAEKAEVNTTETATEDTGNNTEATTKTDESPLNLFNDDPTK